MQTLQLKLSEELSTMSAKENSPLAKFILSSIWTRKQFCKASHALDSSDRHKMQVSKYFQKHQLYMLYMSYDMHYAKLLLSKISLYT